MTHWQELLVLVFRLQLLLSMLSPLLLSSTGHLNAVWWMLWGPCSSDLRVLEISQLYCGCSSSVEYKENRHILCDVWIRGLWKESTGECLHTSSIHSAPAYGLEPISQNKFVSGLADGTIVVWDDNLCCLEWFQTKSSPIEITKVGNALVILRHEAIEIRQLK